MMRGCIINANSPANTGGAREGWVTGGVVGGVYYERVCHERISYLYHDEWMKYIINANSPANTGGASMPMSE